MDLSFLTLAGYQQIPAQIHPNGHLQPAHANLAQATAMQGLPQMNLAAAHVNSFAALAFRGWNQHLVPQPIPQQFGTARLQQPNQHFPNQYRQFVNNQQQQQQHQSSYQNSKTLWMGSIDQMMDENFIRCAFSSFGVNVNTVKIIRSKSNGMPFGYGFVSFDDENVAQDVLRLLNGKNIPNDERKFVLRPSSRSHQRTVNGITTKSTNYSIFVGKLPLDINDEKLLQVFQSNYPSVLSAKVITNDGGLSKGFGFVTFSSEDDYLNVLQQPSFLIGDQAISISKARNGYHLNNHNNQHHQNSHTNANNGSMNVNIHNVNNHLNGYFSTQPIQAHQQPIYFLNGNQQQQSAAIIPNNNLRHLRQNQQQQSQQIPQPQPQHHLINQHIPVPQVIQQQHILDTNFTASPPPNIQQLI